MSENFAYSKTREVDIAYMLAAEVPLNPFTYLFRHILEL
jgi:hypothetical protein